MNTILIVCIAALGMFIAERLRPAGKLPQVRHWWTRALLLNGAQAAVAWLGAVTWDRWLPGVQLLNLEHLPILPGAALAYLVITFIYYWWHRARHQIPFLWRVFHQVHHSPSRLEILTSFYKHPVEILANGLLSSAIIYSLLGLSPAAAAGAVLMTGLAELFYHWNIKTPYWLGFIIQRPESHRVHHETGRHRHNYSDLPVWDMLFGTFHNPTSSPRQVGFKSPLEQRLGRMLLTVDVHREAN